MNIAELLTDGFGRVQEVVHEVVDGLSADQLAWRAAEDANSIAWLVWHLTRVQDSHIAEVADTEQAWTADGWADRFALPFSPDATGYGQDPADVAGVVVGSDLLAGYYDAVHERTVAYLAKLTDPDLDRIVDTNWTPHVTLGVRLVSVLDDDIQHAGQAAFVRGILPV
ncbi:DUF664 domain-containing protein [Kutzneria buriramensis]|uniref:Uncharacterized protein DUF664 n=1 Tax=Kutzneria buriramensis TaxID=1045776 RepID=A0A3E0I8G4_9PSEU|nr:DUF664 domain-containing protein [Kutzneria buriramensis]REH54425.1 uncharacterized protein DUF664 [Kutzneria buriramensis]